MSEEFDPPPPKSVRTSLMVIPIGISYIPGLFKCPVKQTIAVPVDFSVPVPLNHSDPCFIISGT